MSPRKPSYPGPMARAQSRSARPTAMSKPGFPSSRYFGDDNELDTDPTLVALEMSNNHLQRRMAKLQANTARLKREIWLLQRHIKEFHHPLFETWEADILTRLIEVAHAAQRRKLAGGVAIGQFTFAERETLALAYTNAARQVHQGTLRKLGLPDKYHEALQRYDEVAPYRSPNPFQTEAAFARWLIEEREHRPEKYEFWAKLYPVCYGRSVEESSVIF